MINPKSKLHHQGINPIIAVIIMVVITVVVCGVLYVSVTSLSSLSSSDSEAYLKEMGTQEVPVEPNGMEIYSTLDVKYLLIENDLLCTYKLNYIATFMYESSQNNSQISVPFPQGSIEDIEVKLNGQVIENPTIEHNSANILLPGNRTNNVTISYTARGMNDYNHAIPKNRLIEDFKMRLEINGVEYDYNEDLPKNCLTPDKIENSNERIIMEWDKSNAILKKDIEIELPKKANPFDNYLGLFPALVILVFFLSLFYIEVFKRIELEVKNEYLAFMITPIILLYMILGIALVYLEPIFAVSVALLCLIGATFLIEKKMLPMEKGIYEILLFPSFIVVFVTITIFFRDSGGLIVGTIFLILAIIVALNFLRKYQAPPKPLKEDYLVNDMNRLQIERNEALQEIEKLRIENEHLHSTKKDEKSAKQFCPYCGEKIAGDIESCPKCGMNTDSVNTKCPNCKILLPTHSHYCSNCGFVFRPMYYRDPRMYPPYL